MNNKITKLPDGSAFFTAVVMSEEEAMNLPHKKRPLCFRISSNLYHDIFESIGMASMCWNPKPSSEAFDSTKAEGVAVELCLKVVNELEKTKELDNIKIEKLRKTIAFFASVIKSGENWSETCEKEYNSSIESNQK